MKKEQIKKLSGKYEYYEDDHEAIIKKIDQNDLFDLLMQIHEVFKIHTTKNDRSANNYLLLDNDMLNVCLITQTFKQSQELDLPLRRLKNLAGKSFNVEIDRQKTNHNKSNDTLTFYKNGGIVLKCAVYHPYLLQYDILLKSC